MFLIPYFVQGLLKDHKLTVHVVTEDNRAANMLLNTRNMCRNEVWAFTDYKEANMKAAKGSWGGYKKGKVQTANCL